MCLYYQHIAWSDEESHERILGSSDFVESVLKGSNEAYEKRTEAVVKGLGIDQVIATVAEYLDLDPEMSPCPSP